MKMKQFGQKVALPKSTNIITRMVSYPADKVLLFLHKLDSLQRNPIPAGTADILSRCTYLQNRREM